MKKLNSILGHSGAILTVVLAAASPFVLFGWFQNAIGGMGLRIHPSFSGGELSHTITRPDYRIEVFRSVGRTTPWQRVHPFIQARWTPAAGLPASVSDEVDLDGDGTPDVRVAFRPADLVVDVAPLDARYRAMHSRGVTSFSELIARVNDAVVVRLPVD
jgi:hypothetical protein